MRSFWFLALWSLTSAVGCRDAVNDPQVRPQRPANPAASTRSEELETWDSYHIQGSKVGYVRSIEKRHDQDGQTLVRNEQSLHVKLPRFGEAFEATIKLATTETPEGELLAIEFGIPQGMTPKQGAGTVRDGRLSYRFTAGGKVQSGEAELPADTRGYFAVEQTLRRNPMAPGDVRTLRALLPPLGGVADVATVTLTAKERHPAELLTGTYDLLRIDQVIELPDGGRLEAALWVNDQGEVLKTHQLAGNIETHRTTREIALREADGPTLDLGFDLAVPVAEALPSPHEALRVVYEVRVDDGSIADLFATGISQHVEPLDDRRARVTVWSVRPDRMPPAVIRERAPSEADLLPNSLIQSDDPAVKSMANGAAPGESNSWQVAVALEKLVHESVTSKNYSQAFATAAEVAVGKQGDCTEHAVLLAALCRARGIPARVATGLVYVQGNRSFAYHMWNEVWIDEHWIPLDATLGLGGIGGAHLKLADSNLSGAAAYTGFWPVMQAIGRLKIKVVGVEHP